MDAQSCPKCGEQFGAPETAGQIAPPPQRPAPAPPAAPSAAQVATPAPASPKPPPATVVRPSPPPLPEPAPQRFPPAAQPTVAAGIQGKHLIMVVAVLVAAIAGAVYMARPGLFDGAPELQLEAVSDADEIGVATAAFGDLQVAGIRPYYTEDLKAKVRAVVINHSDKAQSGVRLLAHLSPEEAPLTSPPLASFVIELREELGPQESREIDADLMTLGTLASFPPWKKLRIELEVEQAVAAGDR
ncbi:MAG TPA: hypothetical protein VML01_08620 [Bryobacterales bacterium]|nr:hypothetical protein [Bryobacterales bacterium]